MKRKIDSTIYSCGGARLPESARGMRLAVLADLHNNRLGAGDEDLLRVTKEFAPDAILVPGDLVVGRRGEQDYEPLLYLVKRLRRLAPIYLSPGNHEEKLAGMSGAEGRAFEAFLGRLWELDAEYLENRSMKLRPGLRICGLSLGPEYYKRFGAKKAEEETIRELLGKKRPEEYTILLAHHPNYFPAYAAWGADLVVSGHQHGGLFRLPFVGGVISPQLELFPKYDAGEYTEGESHMILSRGLGSHALDLRFLGNAPEFVGIVLDS